MYRLRLEELLPPDVERVIYVDTDIVVLAVVHFNRGTSLGRPWEVRCTHPFRDRWFEALDHTAWAGWRPPPPDTRLPVRVARRLSRTARTLLG